MELTKKELDEINGGGFLSNLLIIGGIVTFIVGIVDGYVRPLKCNK